MTVWRYTAVPIHESGGAGARRGDLVGAREADVRAALRQVGLQVIDLRPMRRPATDAAGGSRSRLWALARQSVRDALSRHLRGRRQHERAELYDGLATMLDSGLPLMESLDTMVASGRSASRLRSMLAGLREALRSGSSLADAMGEHASWFDPSEIAMVRAGQHGGTLPDVLRALAQRHERSGDLSQKLAGALAYPSVVAMVGLGVVVFLSVKTLPSLAQVLTDAGIETPALTRRVMGFGQLLAGHWLVLGLGALLVLAGGAIGAGAARSRGVELPAWLRRMTPRVLRRMAIARMSLQLAELLRSGVPVVEALRVVAPTIRGRGSRGSLCRRLMEGADRVERGEDLAAALDDELWFDPQFRRLLEIGQASGELDALLERVGHHYGRQADRLIDRLAALLEPCVILALAALVGTVVMAAVLPLLRLQEVI